MSAPRRAALTIGEEESLVDVLDQLDAAVANALHDGMRTDEIN